MFQQENPDLHLLFAAADSANSPEQFGQLHRDHELRRFAFAKILQRLYIFKRHSVDSNALGDVLNVLQRLRLTLSFQNFRLPLTLSLKIADCL